MENSKAIPEGYMTVGEIAKRMNTTVRTLQYYDREGLLSPSAESAGGRRLYTHKDMVMLHQIMTMKYLGFSLNDIKNRIPPLDNPADVAEMLSEHARTLREKMDMLAHSVEAIETLRSEVLLMHTVDFKKYADIITNLWLKNEYYWVIKHIDDGTLEHFRNRFDMESAPAMIDMVSRLNAEAERLHISGADPAGEEGLAFAEQYWDMLMEFCKGDMNMLNRLTELADVSIYDEGRKKHFERAFAFITPALSAYFDKLGIDPFKGDNT